jgi:hypothetical protein
MVSHRPAPAVGPSSPSRVGAGVRAESTNALLCGFPVASSVLHVHNPANANIPPSARQKWIGCFFPSGPTVHS